MSLNKKNFQKLIVHHFALSNRVYNYHSQVPNKKMKRKTCTF